MEADRRRNTDKILDVCENNLRKHYIYILYGSGGEAGRENGLMDGNLNPEIF